MLQAFQERSAPQRVGQRGPLRIRHRADVQARAEGIQGATATHPLRPPQLHRGKENQLERWARGAADDATVPVLCSVNAPSSRAQRMKRPNPSRRGTCGSNPRLRIFVRSGHLRLGSLFAYASLRPGVWVTFAPPSSSAMIPASSDMLISVSALPTLKASPCRSENSTLKKPVSASVI